MKSHFKINLVFWLSLFLGAYVVSATPMQYNYDNETGIQKIAIQKSPLMHGTKVKKQSGKWFRNIFKKKKYNNQKRSSKQLKRAKRKLLWTWFKNQFKFKKKDGSLKVEFWSLASFLIAILALTVFIAGILVETEVGLIVGLIFYGILGAISFLFRNRGRQNIRLYSDYYKGENLTKWAKWITLSPIIALLITLIVILLTIF